MFGVIAIYHYLLCHLVPKICYYQVMVIYKYIKLIGTLHDLSAIFKLIIFATSLPYSLNLRRIFFTKIIIP